MGRPNPAPPPREIANDDDAVDFGSPEALTDDDIVEDDDVADVSMFEVQEELRRRWIRARLRSTT